MITNYNFMRSNYAKVLPLVYDDALSYLETVAQLVNKVNEVIAFVDSVSSTTLTEAKAYTDQEIANAYSEVNEALIEINRLINTLQTNYTSFTSAVNAQITDISNKVDTLEDNIEADIKAVNERTDLAIEQNNEYILSHLSQFLSEIKVINYFTGKLISVQDMFDYLAQLHTENSINFTELANRSKTYTQLKDYNMTFTQMALNGGAIII